MTVTPAFRGAATPILPTGAHTTFSFLASRTGSFRLACLVPGHEEARMYDVLVVTSGGKPAITPRCRVADSGLTRRIGSSAAATKSSARYSSE